MYLNIVSKLLIGATGLFIILRIIGKKAISELTPFDLIYVLILGGILEGSLFLPEISIPHLLFTLGLWGTIIFAIERTAKKSMKASKALQGEPANLIWEGKVNHQALEQNSIDLEQLRAMLRQHGCYSLHDAAYAILEIDGKLSVIRKDEKEVPFILLVDEGRIDFDILESIDHDEDWLREQLRKEGHKQVEDVFYCEWIPGVGIQTATYNESDHSHKKLDG